MISNLRLSSRILWKSPWFTLVAVSTLALGIGASGAIFSFVYTMMFRPLPYADSDKLVRVLWRRNNGYGPGVVPALANGVAERTRSFVSVATIFPSTGCNLTGGGTSEYVVAQKVSVNFFRTLGSNPAAGRDFLMEDAASNEDSVAIISDALWQRRFQRNLSAIGRQMQCNGHSFTIVGVLPGSFRYAKRGDVWIAGNIARYLTDEGMNYGVIARLKPDVSISQAQQDLDSVYHQVSQQSPGKWWSRKNSRGIGAVSYRSWQFGDLRKPVLVFSGAVLLVLLIACANVVGLLLVRANSQLREIAIRLALGARRPDLMKQFLMETLLLNLFGAVVGIFFAWWLLHAMSTIIPAKAKFLGMAQLDLEGSSINLPVVIFMVVISLLTGLVSGLAPGLALKSVNFGNALKQAAISGNDRRVQRRRKLLLGAEVALSLMLLVGAMLLMRSFVLLQGVNPGFDPSGLHVLQLSFASQKYASPQEISNFQTKMLERLNALPGVVRVAGVSSSPLESGLNLPSPEVDGKECTNDGTVDYRAITPGYFQVVRTPVLRGREFQLRDAVNSEPVAIISETLARMCWPRQDPIGQQVWIGKGQGALEDVPRQIVGVVADIKDYALDLPAPPVAFVPQAQVSQNINMLLYQSFNLISAVMVRTSGSVDLSVGAQRVIESVDPEQPIVSLSPMTQIIGDSIAFSRLLMLLMGVFAGFAILLTTVGMYGLFSYQVSLRAHEIGVRMALGAARLNILSLVLREGMLLAIAGGALGLAGAVVETRLMRSLLFGVTPLDPVAFAASLFCMLIVILLSSYLPARRAMLVDPNRVLRYE